MYGPVNSLLNIQVDWIRSMALFTRIFEYFDMKPEIENPEHPIIPDTSTGCVKFDHVRFSYDPPHEILKDICFELPAGNSIALVGPSGSGKSTTVNLIPRLYDATGGTVYFENVDVKQLDLTWLRSRIGVVTQDTYLFNGTIRENLLYAKPDATEEDLIDACKKANIYDFIEKQELGLDSVVGNRGLKLSGGENQRISIARCILKDAPIVILDEATASVDADNERAIQEAISELCRNKTLLVIAHRLKTIRDADQILVISDGKIIEKGDHESLMSRQGAYARMVTLQAS
jgi:ATP-binding cassette subfamily B protein